MQPSLGRSVRTRGSAVLTPGELFGVHEHDHRLVRFAEHGNKEAHRDVGAVVAVLIVDDVATWLPERLACVGLLRSLPHSAIGTTAGPDSVWRRSGPSIRR